MSGKVIQNESAAVMRVEPQAALPYARALHRWRFLIILVGAAIGVLGIVGLNRVVFDPDVLIYFDRKMPERQALEAIEDRFGMTNEAVFVLRSREGSLLVPARLEGIRFLHESAQKLPGVLNVRSVLSLAGGPQLPATPEAIAKLREAVRTADRAGRAVLSEDETVGAVAAIVPRNSRNDIDIIGTAQAVRKLQADFRQRFPRIEALMTGRLMMDNAFLVDGQDETFFYAGVQIAVLALVLLVTFLSAIAAALLMAMVLTAALATVGATGWIGFPLNGISSAAPSVLLGLAVAIAVHLVMAWQAAPGRAPNHSLTIGRHDHTIEARLLGNDYGEHMATARTQSPNRLAASELTKAHDFLFEADLLVTDVKSLFRNSGDFVMAARLKDIQARLADEIQAVERLLTASKPAFHH